MGGHGEGFGHNSFIKWKVQVIWVGWVEGVKDRRG